MLVHSKASALCIVVDLSDLLTLKFFLCRLCDDNTLVRQLDLTIFCQQLENLWESLKNYHCNLLPCFS